MNERSFRRFVAMSAFCCWAAPTLGQTQGSKSQPEKNTQPPRPTPDVANASYGPHERNLLDLWRAKSDRPTPLVIFIHGGGFRGGDKSGVSPPLVVSCLKQGISVAAINYRLSQHAPFPAPMLDSVRAVQYLRSRSSEWNLDPKRFGATGGSAGAGISLWMAFHDDLGNPASADPVARQSSRLTCVAVHGAQTTYDPREIKKLIGGRAHEHPALLPFYGLKLEEVDLPRAHKLYEEASPMTYISTDDPPVLLFYTEPNEPMSDTAQPGAGIHHPRFGFALRERLAPLKVECVVRHRDDYKRPGKYANEQQEMLAFFSRHFGLIEPK